MSKANLRRMTTETRLSARSNVCGGHLSPTVFNIRCLAAIILLFASPPDKVGSDDVRRLFVYLSAISTLNLHSAEGAAAAPCSCLLLGAAADRGDTVHLASGIRFQDIR